MVDKKINPPNPTGKGGFQERPEDRHSGAWKKDDTPRYKLEQMMKLSEEELKKVASDSSTPYFERKIAIALNKGDWKTIREMIHEVYGRPKESVDLTSGGKELPTPILRLDSVHRDHSND